MAFAQRVIKNPSMGLFSLARLSAGEEDGRVEVIGAHLIF